MRNLNVTNQLMVLRSRAANQKRGIYFSKPARHLAYSVCVGQVNVKQYKYCDYLVSGFSIFFWTTVTRLNIKVRNIFYYLKQMDNNTCSVLNLVSTHVKCHCVQVQKT